MSGSGWTELNMVEVKKATCRSRGRPILQSTADKRNGLCVPCHHAAALIPPEDFEIPKELGERLVAMRRQVCHGQKFDTFERQVQRPVSVELAARAEAHMMGG